MPCFGFGPFSPPACKVDADDHDDHHNGGDGPLKEGVFETGQQDNSDAELPYLEPIMAAPSALAREKYFQRKIRAKELLPALGLNAH